MIVFKTKGNTTDVFAYKGEIRAQVGYIVKRWGLCFAYDLQGCAVGPFATIKGAARGLLRYEQRQAYRAMKG